MLSCCLHPFPPTTIQLHLLTFLGCKPDTFSVCPRGLIPLRTAKALQLCGLRLLTLPCAVSNASPCCTEVSLLSELVTSPNGESFQLLGKVEDSGHPTCRRGTGTHVSYFTCRGSHKEFVTEPGTETTSSQSQSSLFNHKTISKKV